ncbi:cyclic pyranopterin monophosphate synthase MoaC [Fibrobacterota bacterium]
MALSHVEDSGNLNMVDVSAKDTVKRTARAKGKINMKMETLELLKQGALKKGDALACARVAGITGAKRTSDLIPLCHNIFIDRIGVEFQFCDDGVEITSETLCTARTGIEMEALTAVSLAALTIYDMCKAVDKEMVISDIRLVEKKKERLKS